jgi:hypothetical protein
MTLSGPSGNAQSGPDIRGGLSDVDVKRGGSDAVYYGRKVRGATNESEDDSELRASSAAMAGHELLNERPSERTRVLGTLHHWLSQRFGG